VVTRASGRGPARERRYEIDLLSSLQAQRESVQKLSHHGKALKERGEKIAQDLQEINRVDLATMEQRKMMRILLIVGGFFLLLCTLRIATVYVPYAVQRFAPRSGQQYTAAINRLLRTVLAACLFVLFVLLIVQELGM
jgi:hypothetical protein